MAYYQRKWKPLTYEKWLESNGFNENGITYILAGGDTYSIKDRLKEAGLKYSPILQWHGPEKLKIGDEYTWIPLNFSHYYVWNEAEGCAFLIGGSADEINALINPKTESTSKFVGEVGDRLRDILVMVKSVAGFDTAYGYKYVYTFEDIDGNIFTWFTATQKQINRGDTFILTGTVKEHKTYKGVDTTYLSRCTLAEADDE